MDFVKSIDFDHDDGVNLPMINDFMRNQFYDRMLSRYVNGQYCTDIGFGTGLLTMLALKHGARHVRAFESNQARYQLGVEIIKQMNLQNQVELINERYSHHHHEPTPITFSEIVDGRLWGEGLWHCLPRTDTKEIFLPGNYFLEIWAVDISDTFARELCRRAKTKTTNYNPFFTPGVDVEQKFVDIINKLSNRTPPTSVDTLPQGIVEFMKNYEAEWEWRPYLAAIQFGKVVAGYSIDSWVPNKNKFELSIPTSQWKNSTVLIVPRVGMQQDHDRFYLDTGHWGPVEFPILLVKPEHDLIITQKIKTGLITYSMET